MRIPTRSRLTSVTRRHDYLLYFYPRPNVPLCHPLPHLDPELTRRSGGSHQESRSLPHVRQRLPRHAAPRARGERDPHSREWARF